MVLVLLIAQAVISADKSKHELEMNHEDLSIGDKITSNLGAIGGNDSLFYLHSSSQELDISTPSELTYVVNRGSCNRILRIFRSKIELQCQVCLTTLTSFQGASEQGEVVGVEEVSLADSKEAEGDQHVVKIEFKKSSQFGQLEKIESGGGIGMEEYLKFLNMKISPDTTEYFRGKTTLDFDVEHYHQFLYTVDKASGVVIVLSSTGSKVLRFNRDVLKGVTGLALYSKLELAVLVNSFKGNIILKCSVVDNFDCVKQELEINQGEQILAIFGNTEKSKFQAVIQDTEGSLNISGSSIKMQLPESMDKSQFSYVFRRKLLGIFDRKKGKIVAIRDLLFSKTYYTECDDFLALDASSIFSTSSKGRDFATINNSLLRVFSGASHSKLLASLDTSSLELDNHSVRIDYREPNGQEGSILLNYRFKSPSFEPIGEKQVVNIITGGPNTLTQLPLKTTKLPGRAIEYIPNSPKVVTSKAMPIEIYMEMKEKLIKFRPGFHLIVGPYLILKDRILQCRLTRSVPDKLLCSDKSLENLGFEEEPIDFHSLSWHWLSNYIIAKGSTPRNTGEVHWIHLINLKTGKNFRFFFQDEQRGVRSYAVYEYQNLLLLSFTNFSGKIKVISMDFNFLNEGRMMPRDMLTTTKKEVIDLMKEHGIKCPDNLEFSEIKGKLALNLADRCADSNHVSLNQIVFHISLDRKSLSLVTFSVTSSQKNELFLSTEETTKAVCGLDGRIVLATDQNVYILDKDQSSYSSFKLDNKLGSVKARCVDTDDHKKLVIFDDESVEMFGLVSIMDNRYSGYDFTRLKGSKKIVYNGQMAFISYKLSEGGKRHGVVMMESFQSNRVYAEGGQNSEFKIEFGQEGRANHEVLFKTRAQEGAIQAELGIKTI